MEAVEGTVIKDYLQKWTILHSPSLSLQKVSPNGDAGMESTMSTTDEWSMFDVQFTRLSRSSSREDTDAQYEAFDFPPHEDQANKNGGNESIFSLLLTAVCRAVSVRYLVFNCATFCIMNTSFSGSVTFLSC